MKLVALAAIILVLSYVPRFIARLPPEKRIELGRGVVAVGVGAGLVFVFRYVGVIAVTVGVLAYYLFTGGAAQGYREWLFGARQQGTARRRRSTAANHRGEMTRAEALDVLGLREGATRDEILSQYRVLMRKVHPDVPGGSEYLATRVNKAKEVLLGDR